MQQHLGALAGRTHEPAEGLVHFLQAGDLVHAPEGGLAAESRVDVQARLLHRVDLRQRRADHHRVGHAAAEEVDAFRETAAEDKEERVGQHEAFLNPGGLGRKIGQPRLLRDAQDGAVVFQRALHGFGIGVGGEEDGDPHGCRVTSDE